MFSGQKIADTSNQLAGARLWPSKHTMKARIKGFHVQADAKVQVHKELCIKV